MAVTVLSAWLAVRRRPGAFLLDGLATVPLVFPGIVLGVAMIQILLAAPVPVSARSGPSSSLSPFATCPMA